MLLINKPGPHLIGEAQGIYPYGRMESGGSQFKGHHLINTS